MKNIFCGIFYGVDEKLIIKLLEWRGRLEENYKDIKAGKSDEETALLQETFGRRRQIEREIEQRLLSLRSGSAFLNRKRRQLIKKSETLAAELLQAESDNKAFSSNILAFAIVAVIMQALLLPFIGAAVQANYPKPKYNVSSTYSINGSGSGYDSDRIISVPKLSGENSNYYYDLPDENITDEEIADLTENEKIKYAANLFNEANSLTYSSANDTDYNKAKKYLRLAVRLKSDNKTYLDRLGEILYKHEEYEESLKYFQRSLLIDDKNNSTKIYIAINYLNLNKFRNARIILLEVTADNPNLQSGFFNLGLANVGLRNYSEAAENFRQAVKLDPTDADSRYELVVCLYKSGDKKNAQDAYFQLLKINRESALRLRNEINF